MKIFSAVDVCVCALMHFLGDKLLFDIGTRSASICLLFASMCDRSAELP